MLPICRDVRPNSRLVSNCKLIKQHHKISIISRPTQTVLKAGQLYENDKILVSSVGFYAHESRSYIENIVSIINIIIRAPRSL